MVVHRLFFASFVEFALCQDERNLQKIFIPYGAKKDRVVAKKAKFKIFSPQYQLDITESGRTESIGFANIDGSDWCIIKDHKGREIFKYKFRPKGADARILRMTLHKLSRQSKALIFYYYEGYTEYVSFLGTGRLYFLTIDNNGPQTLTMAEGPIFWQEFKGRWGQYFRRSYSVAVRDYDGDGIRDISVSHHLIKDIYFYRPGGKWRRPPKAP